jgi:hypothetical protein
VVEQHSAGFRNSAANIAAEHGVPLEDFLEWNDFYSGYVLQPGEEYIIKR